MSLDKDQKKGFKQMVEAVSEEAYQKVGQRLIDESKKQQTNINQELIDRLDKWDKDVKDRVKLLMDEELVLMIRKILKEEGAKS